MKTTFNINPENSSGFVLRRITKTRTAFLTFAKQHFTATTVLLYLLIGLIIGFVIAFLAVKLSHVSRSQLQESQNLLQQKETELATTKLQLNEFAQKNTDFQNKITSLEESNDFLKTQSATSIADNKAAQEQLIDSKSKIADLETQTQKKNDLIISLNSRISEISAINDSLQEKLDLQKQEVEELHQVSQLKFEQLANKILEEKSEKFTTLNQNQLKNLLDPFKENIQELKKTVNETYDKEAKERFSLGERVKELQQLNHQISEEARNLTKALKGETKTQGNWGEMILESILEKSGLVKDREYFLEYQLHDKENNALRSDSEDKKMRPDVMIKYPDQRNVIIDSKVSLNAFTRMIDAEDPMIYDQEMTQHLAAIRQHINTLSKKGYDDFDQSLDFVMMFIPSEPAYIAAMQGDPNLWNYAYEKRILLLSPTNLITSLKLISDLWKREYQNQNAMNIAERGAKLYDKFVGFIESLDKVGKSLEQAQFGYQTAYKQLTSGKDNLVLQSRKLTDLGVKNKKNLPQHLIDAAENDTLTDQTPE